MIPQLLLLNIHIKLAWAFVEQLYTTVGWSDELTALESCPSENTFSIWNAKGVYLFSSLRPFTISLLQEFNSCIPSENLRIVSSSPVKFFQDDFDFNLSLQYDLCLTGIMDEAAQCQQSKSFVFSILGRLKYWYEAFNQAQPSCSPYPCIWKDIEHVYEPCGWHKACRT